MKRTTTHLVMPIELNPYGNLFGGTMMGWMDKIAVILAMERTGNNCVTLFADQIKFIKPVTIQEVVDLEAQIIEEGLTSLLISVKASKRKTIEPYESRQLVAESIFKFVALNKEGKPTDRWMCRKNIEQSKGPSFDLLNGRLSAKKCHSSHLKPD